MNLEVPPVEHEQELGVGDVKLELDRAGMEVEMWPLAGGSQQLQPSLRMGFLREGPSEKVDTSVFGGRGGRAEEMEARVSEVQAEGREAFLME
jgi:hypothetical protein